MGSKRRIAKEILPIILKDREEGQWYVEPFCGGCNTIDKVIGNRLANDIHTPLIALYKALQEGFAPPETVTEEEYNQAKKLEDTNPLKGFIGFNVTFGSKWFGGYARPRKNGYDRDAICGKIELERQRSLLQEVRFTNHSYQQLTLPDNSLIYCDPPYRNSTGYKDKFNHEEFYDWCRAKRAEGHTIFISEYTLPEDFICVWQREQTTALAGRQKSLKAVEKLFTLP